MKKILKHISSVFMIFFLSVCICEVNSFPNCINTCTDFLKQASLHPWQAQNAHRLSAEKQRKLLKWADLCVPPKFMAFGCPVDAYHVHSKCYGKFLH